MSESTELREKRLELAELEQGKAYTDPALYEVLHQTLLDDIAVLEGQAVPERPRLTLPTPPRRPDPPPTPEPKPAAPAAQEKPMARPNSAPQARLATLMERLVTNLAEKKAKAASITRMNIRRHCEADGLPMPEEAAIQVDSCPKKFRTGGTVKIPAGGGSLRSMPARALLADEVAGPLERAEEPARVDLPPAIKAVYFYDERTPAAARIRALRSQALDLLPDLEDLEQDAAKAAHEEMDLLAEALVLGGKLIARRTA
ncbi:MAG TPA: hypothetical protein DHV93_08295 [Holophagaceae bacterium]|nr:hypothetical protein [Holophagaceae bacterium]